MGVLRNLNNQKDSQENISIKSRKIARKIPFEYQKNLFLPLHSLYSLEENNWKMEIPPVSMSPIADEGGARAL